MTVSKQKILVILTTKEYMNNYLYTGALDEIHQKYHVTVVIPETLINFVPKGNSIAIVSMPDSVFNLYEKNFRLLTDIYRRKFRKKSKSFSYREKKIDSILRSYIKEEFNRSIRKLLKSCGDFFSIPSRLFLKTKKTSAQSKLKILNYELKSFLFSLIRFMRTQLGLLKRMSQSLLRKILLRLLTTFIISDIAQIAFGNRVKMPVPLYNFLTSQRFDLVALPSAAFEPIVIHLAKTKTDLGFKFLMLTDNWDNLSSKTVLWLQPDAIATWGEQSSQHAVDIQGFPREKVHEIGTARFSNHIISREVVSTSPEVGDYVLFVGTFLNFNEYECLRILNEEISTKREIYGELKILYRPHPFTPPSNNLIAQNLETVLMDQSIIGYKASTEVTAIDFEDTLKIQLNSRFVIGGLTSMLIESSILGKNFLALVHEEVGNFTSPHIVRSSHEHFVGIEALPNLHFVENLADLASQFEEVFHKKNLPQEEIDRQLSYFYDLKPLTYSQKLGKLVEEILL
jgi:hypothetical protein